MKKFFSLVVTTTLAFIVNCYSLTGYRNPVGKPLVTKRLYVDDTFTNSDVKCIESAADSWVKRTKGLANIVVVPLTRDNKLIPAITDKNDVILVKTSSSSGIVYFIERSSGALLYGYHQPMSDHSVITLVTDRYKDENVCIFVVMHEIGHSLGLHHNDDSTSLMYGGADSMPTKITRRDLSDFCKVYGCRAEELDD